MTSQKVLDEIDEYIKQNLHAIPLYITEVLEVIELKHQLKKGREKLRRLTNEIIEVLALVTYAGALLAAPDHVIIARGNDVISDTGDVMQKCSDIQDDFNNLLRRCKSQLACGVDPVMTTSNTARITTNTDPSSVILWCFIAMMCLLVGLYFWRCSPDRPAIIATTVLHSSSKAKYCSGSTTNDTCSTTKESNISSAGHTANHTTDHTAYHTTDHTAYHTTDHTAYHTTDHTAYRIADYTADRTTGHTAYRTTVIHTNYRYNDHIHTKYFTGNNKLHVNPRIRNVLNGKWYNIYGINVDTVPTVGCMTYRTIGHTTYVATDQSTIRTTGCTADHTTDHRTVHSIDLLPVILLAIPMIAALLAILLTLRSFKLLDVLHTKRFALLLFVLQSILLPSDLRIATLRTVLLLTRLQTIILIILRIVSHILKL